jgi:hypothetical protein
MGKFTKLVDQCSGCGDVLQKDLTRGEGAWCSGCLAEYDDTGAPVSKRAASLARAAAIAQSARGEDERASRLLEKHSGYVDVDSEIAKGDALEAYAKALNAQDVGRPVQIVAPQLDDAIMAKAMQLYRDRGSPAPASRWLPKYYNEVLAEPRNPFLPQNSQTNPTWGQTLQMAASTEKAWTEQQDLMEKRDTADAAIEKLVADVQKRHPDWSALQCRDVVMRSEPYQQLYKARLGAQRQLQKMTGVE